MTYQQDNTPENQATEPTAEEENSTQPEATTEAEPQIDELSALKQQCETYQQEIAQLNDKALRTLAENQNIRRRAEQDVQKARDYAIEKFAKDMVGIHDHLFRASDNLKPDTIEQHPELASLKEGIELTKREMTNGLERHHIKRIDPKNQPFDHNQHQALSQVESEQEPETIVDVVQAGYTIKDRLLRPALVTVAKAKEATE